MGSKVFHVLHGHPNPAAKKRGKNGRFQTCKLETSAEGSQAKQERFRMERVAVADVDCEGTVVSRDIGNQSGSVWERGMGMYDLRQHVIHPGDML